MAYRRLPNTDNARIRALKRAIDKCNTLEGKQVVNTDATKLKGILRSFESAQILYKSALDIQVESSKKLQKLVKNARLYVSHFIQVLNMSVMRNEIKKEHKVLYGLDIDEYIVPDLSTNEQLMLWGEKVMQGEQIRQAQGGGAPIYNPSIARVNVQYSLFRDAYIAQKKYQNNTQRQLDMLSSQRDDVDNVLRDVWNAVEAHYADYPRSEMLDKCREYGVIYYIRKREKENSSEDN